MFDNSHIFTHLILKEFTIQEAIEIFLFELIAFVS
jgi:hypothetical protein